MLVLSWLEEDLKANDPQDYRRSSRAKPSSDSAQMKGPLWLILAVAADELLIDSENAFYPPRSFQQMSKEDIL